MASLSVFWLVIGIVVMRLFKRGVFRFAYQVWNFKGPSLWELKKMDAKKVLSENIVTHICNLCLQFSHKPFGFLTMSRDFVVVISDPETIGEVYQKNSMIRCDKSEIFHTQQWRMNNNGNRNIFGSDAGIITESELNVVVKGTVNIVESLRAKADSFSFDLRDVIDLEITDIARQLISSKQPKTRSCTVSMKTVNPAHYWILQKFNKPKTQIELFESSADKLEIPFLEELDVDVNRTVKENKYDAISTIEHCFRSVFQIGDLFGNDDGFKESFSAEVATIETAKSTVKNALLLLALHPNVQRRTVEELEAIYRSCDQQPTQTDVDKMEYLGMVIDETLRLFPGSPFVMKKSHEEINLNGTIIPKGSCLLLNILSVHHNPDIYKDPSDFHPERFLPDVSSQRHPWSFVPLSCDINGCIGNVPVMVLMKVILSSLLRQFQVLPTDGFTRINDVKRNDKMYGGSPRCILKLVSQLR